MRIYDHAKATDPVTGERLYRPTDFNPVLVIDKPTVRGRFSARQSPDSDEWYSYLYLGEQRPDERTAYMECLDILGLGLTPDGSSRVIDPASVANLSFVYMRINRNITLLDMTNEANASVFQADLATLQGDNYRMTRRWARYFRSVVTVVDGICYTPKKYGSSEDGANVVLFAPHLSTGDMIDTNCTEVPLDSRQGIARMLWLGRYTNIYVTGW